MYDTRRGSNPRSLVKRSRSTYADRRTSRPRQARLRSVTLSSQDACVLALLGAHLERCPSFFGFLFLRLTYFFVVVERPSIIRLLAGDRRRENTLDVVPRLIPHVSFTDPQPSHLRHLRLSP
jgi:hypothetical protein